LSTPGTSTPATRNASAGVEAKPGYRTKTVATRITPEELREVERAAEREGKTLAEWLRDLALKAARQRPADPMELLLSEQSATRLHAPESLPCDRSGERGREALAGRIRAQIRDQANARKLADARKMIESFHAQDAQEGQNGGRP